MHIKKFVILSAVLISFTACSSGNKATFSDLKSYVNAEEKKLEQPIQKKSIDETEFTKNENLQKSLKDFKLILEHLENKKEVQNTGLKNEKTIEFIFEGKKYDLILETVEEFEKQKVEKARTTPLVFIRKYDGNSSKTYEIDVKNSDSIIVYEIGMYLNSLINK